MKTCHVCKESKPLGEYGANNQRKDGLNHRCKPCQREYMQAWKTANKDKVAASTRRCRVQARKQQTEWREINSEYMSEYHRKRHIDNREAFNAKSRKYQKENAATIKAKSREYYEANKESIMARSLIGCHKRKAQKLNATPAWANEFIIEEIFDMRKLRTDATGVLHHVDHIVPLQHKLVCGLHCEDNLQVITAQENWSKNNNWWPNMQEIR